MKRPVDPTDSGDSSCLILKIEDRAEGKLLYQFAVMVIGLGVKMKQRRAPMLGTPLLYEV